MFYAIWFMFYLFDNRESENNSNKMAEVDPIYDTLNIAFIQYGIFHTFLSEDKSMVTYYGRNSSFVANQFFLGIKLMFLLDVLMFLKQYHATGLDPTTT